MNTNELYIGMRITTRANFDIERFEDEPGTIICLSNKNGDYDCLVEFDNHVGGHDGLNWGNVKGEEGHCYWFKANEIVAIEDEPAMIDLESLNIGYNELFSQE